LRASRSGKRLFPALFIMSRTLLMGPSGAGKTACLLDEFVSALKTAPDPLASEFYFVLPSAEHTGRVISLILQRGVTGFFHRRVTTLARLIPEWFGLGDEGVAGNVTRYLILRELFVSRRWSYFEAVQDSPGFLNLMLDFIAELKESLISPACLRERMNHIKQIEPAAASKYEALADIYESYEAALAARGLRDPQDSLALYRAMKKESGSGRTPRLKKVWLDGFFDFSDLQREYVRELCEISDEVTIALTLETQGLREDLFEPVHRTRESLEAMEFRPRVMAPGKNRDLPRSLVRLNEGLFACGKSQSGPVQPEGLTVLEAVGMEGEIEMVAREIERLRRAGDYRFSDFAVLFRQVGDYDGVIRSVFARYDIPVEIHERERLRFSPMIQIIVKMLKVMCDGWPRSELMDFLKSSYVRRLNGQEKNYEWVSRLEHRALQSGVFCTREKWLALESGLAPLAALEDRLRGAGTFEAIREGMRHAVTRDLGIFEGSDSLQDAARRDAASFRRFENILGEIGSSLSDSQARSPGPLFEIFADRFFRLAELDLYSLHEMDRNRVQVYSVSLARQKAYRVVFLAGMLEKKFPVQIREDAVLSDWERSLFNADRDSGCLRLRLPSQGVERYLFYLAVTRASEKLYFSYPRLDLEGKESLPSYYLEEVRALFGTEIPTRRQNLGRPYPAWDEAANRRELEAAVLGTLWNTGGDGETDEALTLSLLNRLLESPDAREKIRRASYEVLHGFSDPAVAASGVFRARKTSATRLETYGRCPFRYYARYVLELADPEEDRNSAIRGTVLHRVLEKCFEKWIRDPGGMRRLPRAKKLALAELEKALAEYPLMAEKKYRYDLDCEDLRRTIECFLDHELPRLAGSPLQPHRVEFDFGSSQSKVPPYAVSDGERTLEIRGKIDRIDLHAPSGVGAVIDYKSQSTFKKSDLGLGISLQLALYTAVLRDVLKIKPAGAEIYSLKKLDQKGFYHADHTDLFPGISKRRMILTAADFDGVIERAFAFSRKFSREMEQARIPVRPRACDHYCPYAPVCRIEKWRLPLILEEIRAEDRREGFGGEFGEGEPE